MKREWLNANRRIWNERTPLHVESAFYGVEAFTRGAPVLHDFEIDDVGPVSGKSLVHLQCHFGLDTLDWARRGAAVAGLDLSEVAIDTARRLADEIGESTARFVVSDVYDAEAVLRESFDVVYTGRGALNWLPDVRRWAKVVHGLLAPGGFLYLNEFHPLSEILAEDRLEFQYDYFGGEVVVSETDGATYVETDARTPSTRMYEWTHPISEVIGSLIDAGLSIELFREYDFSVYRRFPMLEQSLDGIRRVYRWPEGQPALPLMYSLRARRSA
jgi:SAM-dependent methyltransferase